jgi:protein-S-isoprenylcysteine O-methyltransferase Ste14
VHEPSWWAAIALTSVTALVFVASMVGFFRARRGHMPLRLALVASIAGGLVAVFAPLAGKTQIGEPAFAIGCGLLVMAQTLFWWAVAAHGATRPSAAFAVDPPETLTVRGPYRLVRHPFYLAYVLAFAGGAALTETPWVWVVPAWLAIMYIAAARQEERLILASPLGRAYGEYMERIGGFVPWIRLTHADPRSRRS